MLKRIGAEEGGEFKAVASGTLPSGRPVVVNADGTVSVVSQEASGAGAATVYNATNTSRSAVGYDSVNKKIVIVYTDAGNSSHGTAIVGTVDASNKSISFGSEVVFESATTDYPAIAFDTSAGKFLITYADGGNSSYGTGIVGTVSGNSISFGSPTVFISNAMIEPDTDFDTNAGKFLVCFRDGANSYRGDSLVATISGTSVSFGSVVNINSVNTQHINCVFDPDNNKFGVFYKDNGGDDYVHGKIGTISGTSVSYTSEQDVNSATVSSVSAVYDTTNNKFVIGYNEASNGHGKVKAATSNGSTFSFETEAGFNGSNESVLLTNTAIFDTASGKTGLLFRDGASSYAVKVIDVDTSTSTPSFSSIVDLDIGTSGGGETSGGYDSDGNRAVFCGLKSNIGNAQVYAIAPKNLTSENYIGMSRGVVNATSLTQTIGSAVTFEDADTKYTVATFDSVNNKVIIAYRDNGNGGYLTAIVGTVSGTSISFGTPVVAASNSSTYLGIAFNANAGKCVISYKNASTTYGLAIVGTVSGTSISFGTAAIFNSADTENIIAGYDAASQNVVIAYQDKGNSSYGTAIVAVISGTSVSFGSEVVFQSTNSNPRSIVYDSGSSKIIIGYRKYDSWMRGFGVVGTVSGNSISFGTPVRFDTHNTSGYDIEYISLTYDSNANKTLFTYRGNSQNGQINVATVSGTSISFGTVVTFHAANTQEILSFYDPDAQLHGIAYEDAANTPDFEYVTATISGTSATISSPTAISSNIGSSQMTMGATYDTNANKGVLAYQILSPDSRGTARVIQNASTTITRGQVTNGQAASMDIIGSVSDNQIGLTTGQQYFVQTDGTIGTTAATPSVLAGTAISATELVVKT